MRTFVLELDEGVEIPSLAKVYHSTENYQILLTIPGRGPVCFKCKHTGHTRANCSTPFCRHCSTYGHTSENCASSKSYAASLSPMQPQQQEEVDLDEPEEADLNTASTQDQQGKTGNTDMEAEKRVEDTIK